MTRFVRSWGIWDVSRKQWMPDPLRGHIDKSPAKFYSRGRAEQIADREWRALNPDDQFEVRPFKQLRDTAREAPRAGNPTTKPGEHGTLYLYRITYKDATDSGAPEFTSDKWAYSLEHVDDITQDWGEDGWTVISVARVPEGGGSMHRAIKHRTRATQELHEMDFTKDDLRVFKAFLDRQPMRGRRFETDGARLDGPMFVSRVATWEQDERGREYVATHDLGSRNAQQIHRKLRKMGGGIVREASRMEDRRRGYHGPRQATLSPGTPVRVTDGDSMYRGKAGRVVRPDVNRTVHLDNYNRDLLRRGAVLVEQRNGTLFVVFPNVLEIEPENPVDRGMRDSRVEAPRRRVGRVDDYIAVDRRGRTTAGPFKSYSDADDAAGPADVVQFVPAGRVSESTDASYRIHVRGLESEISLAQHRARKHREAGDALRASIQDDIAIKLQRELMAFKERHAGGRTSEPRGGAGAFRKGDRVMYRSRLFGDTERNYGTIVTGNPKTMKVEGVGDRVPHYQVRHEDDGQSYWHPVTAISVAPNRPGSAPKQIGWDVVENGTVVNHVYFDATMSAPEVRRSLIRSDGYPENITVVAHSDAVRGGDADPGGALFEPRGGTLRAPSDSDEHDGEQYAQDQLESDYFQNWIWEQMADGAKLAPEARIPLETPADLKRLARRMLQDLEFDTRSQQDYSAEFFKGMRQRLNDQSTIDWLAEELQHIDEQIRTPRAPTPAPKKKARRSKRR